MLEHPGIAPSYILQCSAAARRNLRLGRHIYERCNPYGADHNNHQQPQPQQPGKLVMLDLHHIFNAAVILLLHQMVFSNVVNTDTIGIRAARAILENEARTECASPVIGSGGSSSGGASAGFATGYASDCLAVLNDLAALVARIRPLRFKGSEHTMTGVDAVGWRSPVAQHHMHPAAAAAAAGDAGGGTGFASKGPAGSSSFAISDEQIAANLSLENPFGPGSIYGPMPMVYNGHDHMDMVGAGYTNQQELERWVHEGQQVCGMVLQLGGYIGM